METIQKEEFLVHTQHTKYSNLKSFWKMMWALISCRPRPTKMYELMHIGNELWLSPILKAFWKTHRFVAILSSYEVSILVGGA